MLSAAKQALKGVSRPPLLIAVTVLTSMDAAAWKALGNNRTITEQVAFLTSLAADTGLDGVVCSALEAQQIKMVYGDNFVTVTPGIRPSWAAVDDQARIVTPVQACSMGSDYLVVGRPITRASEPAAALARILQELKSIS